MYWKSKIFLLLTTLGTFENLMEMSSYLILYHYLWKHDNQNASRILNQKVITMRNRTNALSLTGLFITLIMEVLFLVLVGFFSLFFEDHNMFRDLGALILMYEYLFIPLAQIYTSPPIRKFISSYSSN
jgi:hypothetical protein